MISTRSAEAVVDAPSPRVRSPGLERTPLGAKLAARDCPASDRRLRRGRRGLVIPATIHDDRDHPVTLPPDGPRLVEVEDDAGRSVTIGHRSHHDREYFLLTDTL